jgi:hypothetical protein
MFHSGTLLLLSALAAQAPASPPPTSNRVEICSVVAGTCSSSPAAALDPTSAPLAGGGQLAFVDPATGALVAPNAEQAAELAGTIELAEEQKAAVEPVVETLANGTVRARGDFRVYLRAEIKPAKAEAKEDQP